MRTRCKNGVDDGGACTWLLLWCVVAWRSETPRCQLTHDNGTVQLCDAAAADDDAADSVLCMSSSASVQCGHSVSFRLHHTHRAAAAAVAAEPLLLSQHDGVGLSVRDNVDVNADDVVFYSFHGNSLHLTDDNDKRKETQRCDKSHVCPDHPCCTTPPKLWCGVGAPGRNQPCQISSRSVQGSLRVKIYHFPMLIPMADGPSFLYEKLVRESWYKKFVRVS